MSDLVKRKDAYKIALHYGSDVAAHKIAQLPNVDVVSMETMKAESRAFEVASLRIALLAKENFALRERVGFLQRRLCEWCAVCPEERRSPDDCELIGKTEAMCGQIGAKMEVQE